MLLLHPYSLYGSIQVSEHCIITFSIGSYPPMAWFHIVPMISCHILLGHPWFDSNKVWNNNASTPIVIKFDSNILLGHPYIIESSMFIPSFVSTGNIVCMLVLNVLYGKGLQNFMDALRGVSLSSKSKSTLCCAYGCSFHFHSYCYRWWSSH